MEITKYIACICEGTAEEVIIDILLHNDKLIFTKNQLIESKPLRCRDAKTFESRYLRKGFSEKISIVRILDSRKENFKLSRAYQHKVNVVNIVTAPEIEMLVILAEGKYTEYKSSRKKPSDFCTQDLRLRYVKSRDFVQEYFQDVNKLIAAINDYKRLSNIPKGEYSLADLLR